MSFRRLSIIFRAALLSAMLLVAASSATAADLVDINHATITEMLKVPGMTASWANRISRFRPYRTKLDLVETGVVPPIVYQRIRSNIIAHHADPVDGKAVLPTASRR